MSSGGKPFPREDNCRRHMRTVHEMVGSELKVVGLDERTKDVREQRRLTGKVEMV